MKVLLVYCCLCFTITKPVLGENFVYDGSGDLKPSKPSISGLSKRIGNAFTVKPISMQKRHRMKTRVKRLVRTVMPGLVKTYLDFHLPEFVQLYVSEYFLADDVIVQSCLKQEEKIEELKGDLVRVKSRLHHMGGRMDELERVVVEYRNAMRKNLILEPKNKTFLETDRNTIDEVALLDTQNVPLLQRSDTMEDTVKLPETENISLLQRSDTNAGDVKLPSTEKVSQLQRSDTMAGTVKPLTPKLSCLQKILASNTNSSDPDILAVSMEDPQFYILTNDTETTFPLKSNKVRAVVFDPTSRNIIWSNYSSGIRGIFSANLRRLRKVKQLSKMSSEGMAVDPCKRWLFFTTISPRPTISRMTTKGRHYRKISDMAKYGTYMYSVALDPDKGFIYTCHQSALVETSYDGKMQQELVSRGSAIYAVTLDLSARMLYYGSWGKVEKLSLEDGVTETVVNVRSSPRNLVYYNSFLYSDKSKLVHVYDIANRVTSDLGKLNGTAISICAVP